MAVTYNMRQTRPLSASTSVSQFCLAGEGSVRCPARPQTTWRAPTPDGIMQLGLGFWGAKTLLSAVELGLFTELAAGPATRGRPAPAAGSAPARRPRLPRRPGGAGHARARGRQLPQQPGRRPIPRPRQADLHRRHARDGQRPALPRSGAGSPKLCAPASPQNEAKHGGDLFGALYADPARLEGFLKAMTGLSAPSAAAIARQFPWDRLPHPDRHRHRPGRPAGARWRWPTRT